ncbi:MAG: hypothetical protein IIZ43_00090 [Eubacterium sp.]|nr:hypothetical protein [Eubacterium sp.]
MMKAGLRKKWIVFILTGMLLMIFAVPCFAADESAAGSVPDAASEQTADGTEEPEAPETPEAPVYSWVVEDGKTYYMDADGNCATGLQVIEEATYYFDETGVMQTGWMKIDGSQYYFGDSGKMTTGWKTIEGYRYHFTRSGVMQTGFRKINGSHYYFTQDGSMADFGIYKKKWMISYNGKCFKMPKAVSSKKTSENRMAKLIAKCSGKSCRKMRDIEKVGRAAGFIQIMYGSCKYSMKGSNYNRPYGVFYAKVASCAGTTRALGAVLTKMGFKWKHVNENKYKHQWCSVRMDGKKGWADGMIGYVGYGAYPF